MITYRLSDMRTLPAMSRFCSTPPDLNVSLAGVSGNAFDLRQGKRKKTSGSSRKKRETIFRDTCLVHVVGDAFAFNYRCRRDYMVCTSLMIAHVAYVDKVFMTSKFEGRLGAYTEGIGLQVGKVTLYTDFTPNLGPRVTHFNEYRVYTGHLKLDMFAQVMGRTGSPFCLNHLFTDFNDPTGIIGRAFKYGLCKYSRLGKKALNTGIISGSGRDGHAVPNLLSLLVYIHETGHNFGSSHDPNTAEYAPTIGGKYIMWSWAVDGEQINNRRFSKCSLRQIGRNVPRLCFVPRSQVMGFCGNGLVDAGEECDTGPEGFQDTDKCCDKDCQLRAFANCNDRNHECCRDCKIVPAQTLCRSFGHLLSCLQDAYCSGQSRTCPVSENKADGEKCGPAHVCSQGVCLHLCPFASLASGPEYNFQPCSCDKSPEDECKYCCYDARDISKSGECKVFSETIKQDGSLCTGGRCESGKCMKYGPSEVVLLDSYLDFVERTPFKELLQRECHPTFPGYHINEDHDALFQGCYLPNGVDILPPDSMVYIDVYDYKKMFQQGHGKELVQKCGAIAVQRSTEYFGITEYGSCYFGKSPDLSEVAKVTKSDGCRKYCEWDIGGYGSWVIYKVKAKTFKPACPSQHLGYHINNNQWAMNEGCFKTWHQSVLPRDADVNVWPEFNVFRVNGYGHAGAVVQACGRLAAEKGAKYFSVENYSVCSFGNDPDFSVPEVTENLGCGISCSLDVGHTGVMVVYKMETLLV